MAFTTRHNFTATLDNTNANELNKIMNREIDTYEERKQCIEDTLNDTTFFQQYFDDYYNVNVSQDDSLALDNNVCRVLENYASYLLNSKDIKEQNDFEYKFYYDENKFMKAVNREQQYNQDGAEIIEYLLTNQTNYKKAKDQKITTKDLKRPDWLGDILRDYDTYIKTLENSSMPLYRINRLKGEVQRDMILTKDSLMKIHGYNLRYFSESTQPDLSVIDFASFNQLKGFTLTDIKDKNTRRVDGLLRFHFNGDFQNDFQCILYDLDKLIEKTELTSDERYVIMNYRIGKKDTQTAEEMKRNKWYVKRCLDSAIQKVNDLAFKMRWRG